MKKFFLSLSLVLTAGLVSAFTGTNIDPRLERTFAKEFAGAENVKWMKLDEGYQKASFTLAGIGVEAYFSSDARLAATVRNLFYNQLPLVVIQAVHNQFANPVVVEVREVNNNEGTTYRIRLEQKAKKYYLYLNAMGEITEVKKIKK